MIRRPRGARCAGIWTASTGNLRVTCNRELGEFFARAVRETTLLAYPYARSGCHCDRCSRNRFPTTSKRTPMKLNCSTLIALLAAAGITTAYATEFRSADTHNADDYPTVVA